MNNQPKTRASIHTGFHIFERPAHGNNRARREEVAFNYCYSSLFNKAGSGDKTTVAFCIVSLCKVTFKRIAKLKTVQDWENREFGRSGWSVGLFS